MSTKLTLKQQILNVLPGGWGVSGLTNYAIADAVNAPEPSVRRATRQLVAAGLARETTARGIDKRFVLTTP